MASELSKACSQSSLPADVISEERFAEAEEERADDANEFRMIERDLSHDMYEIVQNGNETGQHRRILWLRLLQLLHQHSDLNTYLEIPSRETDGLESSPAHGLFTEVCDIQ
jgi:hypothetical protein